MAITKSTTPNKKSQKVKKRVVASLWLIMALLTAAAALALWMFSAAPSFDANAATTEGEAPETVANSIGQINQIDEIHELDSEVKPISFEALIRDLRDYPPEFKDVKYLKKNKGKWTVQVMDVSEHDIITDYLSARDDREKFAYFRYRDENNQPRYLLTYDVLSSPQMAKGVASTTNFDLPANVRVIPEEIDTYVDVIEEYELSGPIKDLSANRTRQVNLRPTKREIAPRRPANTTSPDNQEQQPAAEKEETQTQQSKPSEIKRSNDTSDTLSVQEERKVIVNGEEANNASNNQAEPTKPAESKPQNTNKPAASTESNKPANATKPANNNKPVEPTKPQEATPKKPENKQEADSIKQLIEEKTS